MTDDQFENMEKTRVATTEDFDSDFPFIAGPHSADFKRGRLDYKGITNPWFAAPHELAFEYHGEDVGDTKTPDQFFEVWNKIKAAEARILSRLAKNDPSRQKETADRLQELNSRMAGFGLEAWEHEDHEVAIKAFAMAGVLDNPGVARVMREYTRDAGTKTQNKLLDMYNKIKEQYSGDKVPSSEQ